MNKEEQWFGVIEGFYGSPWTFRQRTTLMEFLGHCGLNTYIYAPKFDVKHRVNWKEKYTKVEIGFFNKLRRSASDSGIRIVIALSPGLQFDFFDSCSFQLLLSKYQQFSDIGFTSFGLFLDDLPIESANPLHQAQLVNKLHSSLNSIDDFCFCPTIYCQMQMISHPNANKYLQILHDNLDPDIRIFWTGSSVISRKIDILDFEYIHNIMPRKIMIWDNIFADDYVPANMTFTGPIIDRDFRILNNASGFLVNPSQNFNLSMIPISTFADFVNLKDEYNGAVSWDKTLEMFFPDNLDILKWTLGYFYSIKGPSPIWSNLLSCIAKSIIDKSSLQNHIKELSNIKSKLHDPANLKYFHEYWHELYPYVRTLYGDLDFLIRTLKKIQSNIIMEFPLIERDVRWSTPIIDMIQKLLNRREKGSG